MGILKKLFKKNEMPEQPQISKLSADVVSAFDYPCEVISTAVYDSNAVFELYRASLADGLREGYAPLIIIPSDIMLELLLLYREDNSKMGRSGADARGDIIRKAHSLNPASVLKARYENAMPTDEPDFNESELIGKIEDGNPLHYFISVSDFAAKRLYPELILAKIPNAGACDLPAYIPMGGFNNCPTPQEQIAIFKYWSEHFAVYPAVVGYDTWECYIANPPLSDTVALGLAKEQMAFCSDIVYQGLNTIGALADSLKGAPVWYFWWD